MPHAKILTKQALYALGQLHSESAGKLLANKREALRLRTSMLQVEAVMKMLSPTVNLRLIAPKRRNVGNPWFKRGTLYRAGIPCGYKPHDGGRYLPSPFGRQAASATRKQENNLQAAILAALRKRNGGA
jgi:hypothetical protein